ncbi:hypothetical protein FB107DRAFT_280927 [Schizophyllum commune]
MPMANNDETGQSRGTSLPEASEGEQRRQVRADMHRTDEAPDKLLLETSSPAAPALFESSESELESHNEVFDNIPRMEEMEATSEAAVGTGDGADMPAIPVLVHAMEGLTNELEQLNRLFTMIPDLIDAATKLDNTLRTAQSAMVAANGLATTEAHIDPLSPMPTSSGDGHYGAHALPRSGSTGIVDSAGPPVHPIRAASPSGTHSGDAGGPPGSPSPAPSHAGDTER